MRITIPIAAGGGRSQTRIPLSSATLDECLGQNGKIDRAKAQIALADRKFFCPSGSDDEYVYFAALTLLGTIHDAYKQVESRPDAVVSAREICKQDTLNSRKVERGKVVYAKIIIERKAATVRVRFEVDNPRNLVGEYEVEARECLIACAEIMLRMRKDVKWLEIADCEITKEAGRRNEEAERKRLTLVTKRIRRGDGDRIVKLYEVDFKDGYSMVIMGRRKPTIDEANAFLSEDINRMKCGSVVNVTDEISEEDARKFYDFTNHKNWVIFPREGAK